MLALANEFRAYSDVVSADADAILALAPLGELVAPARVAGDRVV